jgi:DNA-binding NarL/FixJ family response regulator
MAVQYGVCHHATVPTVLIVDDHPSFRASAKAILEADGFEVTGEAEDGESAIAAAGRLHPDIVRRLIAEDDETCVVLVSSRDGADFGPLVESSGACGFVPKSELSGDAVAALLCAR